MGQHRIGPPETLVVALQQRMSLDCFVETGTFQGNTAAWAAQKFPRVITVELSPTYHAAAVARFSAADNIVPLFGDSKKVLQDVVPKLTLPALFWLDAHWSGADTAGRESECPLLDELRLINASALPHIVLVDDARLFLAPPPPPHRADQWPSFREVIGVLGGGGRRFVALFEDVLIAVPASEREFLLSTGAIEA